MNRINHITYPPLFLPLKSHWQPDVLQQVCYRHLIKIHVTCQCCICSSSRCFAVDMKILTCCVVLSSAASNPCFVDTSLNSSPLQAIQLFLSYYRSYFDHNRNFWHFVWHCDRYPIRDATDTFVFFCLLNAPMLLWALWTPSFVSTIPIPPLVCTSFSSHKYRCTLSLMHQSRILRFQFSNSCDTVSCTAFGCITNINASVVLFDSTTGIDWNEKSAQSLGWLMAADCWSGTCEYCCSFCMTYLYYEITLLNCNLRKLYNLDYHCNTQCINLVYLLLHVTNDIFQQLQYLQPFRGYLSSLMQMLAFRYKIIHKASNAISY